MNRVSGALQRKLGPLPAWAWALILGAGLYVYRNRGGRGALADQQASTGPDAYGYAGLPGPPEGAGDAGPGGGGGSGNGNGNGGGSSGGKGGKGDGNPWPWQSGGLKKPSGSLIPRPRPGPWPFPTRKPPRRPQDAKLPIPRRRRPKVQIPGRHALRDRASVLAGAGGTRLNPQRSRASYDKAGLESVAPWEASGMSASRGPAQPVPTFGRTNTGEELALSGYSGTATPRPSSPSASGPARRSRPLGAAPGPILKRPSGGFTAGGGK